MASSFTSLSQDRLPDWLAEALDVLTARRRLVAVVAIGLVVVGALASLVAPSILPPRPVVGVAVGIAAALLATALALALDASDLVVRGARHVRAAGGHVDVRVGRDHDDVGPLLAAVARHADDGAVKVALTPASRTAAVPGPRATALAEAIARTGRRVLLTDLTRGGSPAAGLSDVVAGERSLAEVVRFEQERYLARLAVGSDPDLAIRGFAAFAESLPSDLEVLVVALPPLAEPGVLRAAGTFDLTLVLAEIDRTERVDLIASLDAMDAAHVSSELVLIDPARRTPRAVPAQPDEDDEATAVDPAPDPEVDHDEPGHDEPGHDESAAAALTDLAGDPDPGPDAETPTEAPTEPPTEEPTVTVLDSEPMDPPTADELPPLEPAASVPGPDDETTAALSSMLEEQSVDDSALADVELIDVADATSDGAAPDAPRADAPRADEPTPDDSSGDATEEIRVLQGAPPPAPADAHEAAAHGTAANGAAAHGAAAHGAAANGAASNEPAAPQPAAPEAAAPEAEADRPSPRDPAPAWFATPMARPAADPFEEDAAFEVARTSAALQQLAQQVWQRQAR